MSLVTVRTSAENRSLVDIITVRDVLGITDSLNDDKIDRLIRSASNRVERFTDRVFARELVTEKLGVDKEGFPEFSPYRMTLSRIPILTIDAARFNGQAVDVSTIEVENSDAGFLYRSQAFGETLIEAQGIEKVRTRFLQPLWEIDYSAGFVLPTFPIVTHSFVSGDVDGSADTITISSHGLLNGDTVEFNTDDTLPGGLAIRRPYLVRDATTSMFKVAERPGDGALDLTDGGSGTHKVTRRRTLPDDVEDAVAQLVVSMYHSLDRDARIVSERLGDHSVTYAEGAGVRSQGGLPETIRGQLSPWIRM